MLITQLIALAWLTNILAWGLYPLEQFKAKYLVKYETLYILLGCTKCLGFWVGLITMNIYYALLISLLATIIEKMYRYDD